MNNKRNYRALTLDEFSAQFQPNDDVTYAFFCGYMQESIVELLQYLQRERSWWDIKERAESLFRDIVKEEDAR